MELAESYWAQMMAAQIAKQMMAEAVEASGETEPIVMVNTNGAH